MQTNLTPQEFFDIAIQRKQDLIQICLKNITFKHFYRPLSEEEIEDTFTEIVLSTAEKLNDPNRKIKITCWNDVRNYLTECFWYYYRDNNKKQMKRSSITSGMTGTVLELPDETEVDPIINNSSEVYHRIFEYVFSNYEQEEAAIYKAHTIDGFTFDQIAEATRYKRYKCYDIYKKIRADVQSKKEYLLAG